MRADGVSDADARRLAIQELDEAGGLAPSMGGLAQAHTAPPIVPGTSRGGRLFGIGQDARDAVRTVRRQPGFAATIIATLALGMAVNTTVFRIVNGVVFRPLPFDDANRIVQLNVINLAKRQDGELSYPESASIGEHVRTLDPDVPVLPAIAVDETLERRLWLQRLFILMFSVFASIAVLLAAGGLYAVTSYAVSRRTREIGFRVALGADARRVWATVTVATLRQLGIGLAIGVAGAVGVARMLPGSLIGPDGASPIVLAGVVGLLIAAGLVATVVPARRAMRVDATVILQTE